MLRFLKPTTTEMATGLLNVVKDSLRKRLGFACDVIVTQPGELPRFELKGRIFHRESSDEE